MSVGACAQREKKTSVMGPNQSGRERGEKKGGPNQESNGTRNLISEGLKFPQNCHHSRGHESHRTHTTLTTHTTHMTHNMSQIEKCGY
jgi:hypothetical protein